MDNGNSAQVVTQAIFKDWHNYPPKMSKKMFKDMKKLGFLYTDDRLKALCQKRYSIPCMLYAFDIPAMVQAGYIAKEDLSR